MIVWIEPTYYQINSTTLHSARKYTNDKVTVLILLMAQPKKSRERERRPVTLHLALGGMLCLIIPNFK